ncbi:hypothetical protein BDV93DRAFT_525168, partial [Ceratobasidium sp. AG-I]
MPTTAKLSTMLLAWDSSRKNLDSAIQTFFETTEAIAAALSQPLDHEVDAVSLEATIDAFYFDLQSFDLRFKALHNARVHTANIRNRSTTQILLNRLPTEIITRIFYDVALNSCTCSASANLAPAPNPDIKTLFALPHVSTRWREIALSTTYLWSHVVFDSKCDKDFRSGPNRPQLWIERARDSELYIHLVGTDLLSRAKPVKPSIIERRLQPHRRNIVGVYIESNWQNRDAFLFPFFWAEGDANPLQEFIYVGSQLWDCLPVEGSLPLPLSSLRVLCLQAMHFPWDSPIYNNLVDLRLGFLYEEHTPTKRQLFQVLSACPKLRVLGLGGHGSLNPEEYHY